MIRGQDDVKLKATADWEDNNHPGKAVVRIRFKNNDAKNAFFKIACSQETNLIISTSDTSGRSPMVHNGSVTIAKQTRGCPKLSRIESGFCMNSSRNKHCVGSASVSVSQRSACSRTAPPCSGCTRRSVPAQPFFCGQERRPYPSQAAPVIHRADSASRSFAFAIFPESTSSSPPAFTFLPPMKTVSTSERSA